MEPGDRRAESSEPEEPEEPEALRIPLDALEPETLRGVIEEFVTRDGTNLAERDTKIEQVAAQLRRGTAEVWFDQRTRTCTIRPK